MECVDDNWQASLIVFGEKLRDIFGWNLILKQKNKIISRSRFSVAEEICTAFKLTLVSALLTAKVNAKRIQ